MCLLGFLRAVRVKPQKGYHHRLLSECGGRFRFGMGEREFLHVLGAVVSALVCVFVVVSWWFCLWLVCVV